MAGWFKMQLGDNWLSTAPHEAKTHWTPAFLPFDPPLDLQKGDSLKFYLSRPTAGQWTWRVTTATTDQKHSTFISQILSSQAIHRAYPKRSSQGNLVYDILSCFDGLTSTQEIANKVAEKHLDMPSACFRHLNN